MKKLSKEYQTNTHLDLQNTKLWHMQPTFQIPNQEIASLRSQINSNRHSQFLTSQAYLTNKSNGELIK
uniref:Uncharacterized protein n=1 Tax=Rhizophora mucronata TaxID=61149 RepID=A0A2P2PE68_RHIMU